MILNLLLQPLASALAIWYHPSAHIVTTVLITGATSGIGREIALAYAAPGIAIVLTGRDPSRLDEVESECRQRGAFVIGKRIDVRD